MFMDADHSISMLKFYHGEINNLLRERADHFIEYTNNLEQDYKKRQKSFDKEYWLKHYDVYSGYYPYIFINSFIISACSLFEFHIKKICGLAKEEHRIPLEWDDMKGNVPKRAKSFLWYGGIQLMDDPPGSFQNWIFSNMPGQKRLSVKELWQELDNYFTIRNCIAHHNGVVDRMKYQKKIVKYASRKGLLDNSKDQKELSLTKDFNIEVCDSMRLFFQKLMSAYYSVPLPEK